jgi:WD40 repeat protein
MMFDMIVITEGSNHVCTVPKNTLLSLLSFKLRKKPTKTKMITWDVGNGTLQLYDLNTFKCIHTYNPVPYLRHSLNAIDDKTFALLASSNTGTGFSTVQLFELSNDEIHFIKSYEIQLRNIIILNRDTLVGTTNNIGELNLFNITESRITQSWSAHSKSIANICKFDDNTIITIGRDRTIKTWDVQTKKLWSTIPRPRDLYRPQKVDHRRAIVYHHYNFQVWDIFRGECIKSFTMPFLTDPVACLDYNHMIIQHNGECVVWSIESNMQVDQYDCIFQSKVHWLNDDQFMIFMFSEVRIYNKRDTTPIVRINIKSLNEQQLIVI